MATSDGSVTMRDEHWAHRRHFATIISARASRTIIDLAISELIADKLPFTPSRLKRRAACLTHCIWCNLWSGSLRRCETTAGRGSAPWRTGSDCGSSWRLPGSEEPQPGHARLCGWAFGGRLGSRRRRASSCTDGDRQIAHFRRRLMSFDSVDVVWPCRSDSREQGRNTHFLRPSID